MGLGRWSALQQMVLHSWVYWTAQYGSVGILKQIKEKDKKLGVTNVRVYWEESNN